MYIYVETFSSNMFACYIYENSYENNLRFLHNTYCI